MDIDLLSKMVKELILDQDRVVLPGLGSFVAEIVPATFSDKGYTINPPYRRLFFRAKPDEGDVLTKFYASSNKVAPEMAERIIKDFLVELKAVLYEKKTVVFPGLGRLRATKENHLFFVADEDLDIYPEGFGLEPISLKTHVETPQQVTAAVEVLRNILEPEPVEDIVEVAEESVELIEESSEEAAEEIVENAVEEVIEEIAEEVAEEVAEEPVEDAVEETAEETVEEIVEHAEPEPIVQVSKKSPWKTVLKVFLLLILITVVLFAAFVVLSQMYPGIMDCLLYTKEELEVVKLL